MGIKQRVWQGHLKAAERSGKSLSAYAAEYGINLRRLYDARYVGIGGQNEGGQGAASIGIRAGQGQAAVIGQGLADGAPRRSSWR